MKTTNYSNMTAIAVNKSLLKEYQTSYGRTVYLDKDSEFQIKLFNPTTDTIGADIIINGKSLGEKLIIRPGQIIWLERYFNEARKFRFDVYEVDAKAEAVKEAIRNNGDIQVKFYKERKPYYLYNNYWYNNLCVNATRDISSPSNEPFRVTCSNANLSYDLGNETPKAIYSTEPATFGSYINHAEGANISGEILGSNVSSVTASNSAYNYERSCERSFSAGVSKKLSKVKMDATMETGRVEKGSYSDQRFTTVDVDLEYFSFATEEIKLLPKSQKPVFKEDLEKLYCPNCGRKVKTKFKFCPFCGGKLQDEF